MRRSAYDLVFRLSLPRSVATVTGFAFHLAGVIPRHTVILPALALATAAGGLAGAILWAMDPKL